MQKFNFLSGIGNKTGKNTTVGGGMASWFVRSTPERAVWVGALAGDIVLCS